MERLVGKVSQPGDEEEDDVIPYTHTHNLWRELKAESAVSVREVDTGRDMIERE